MSRLESFLQQMQEKRPVFVKEFLTTQLSYPESFHTLGEHLLMWAEKILGDETEKKLMDGYCQFVVDVNRSQLLYEVDGHYLAKSYQDVRKLTYDNEAFMDVYHWGVYTTTFAWGHHVRLYEFFKREFLPLLSQSGHLLDLGAGSGVWHMLMLEHYNNWNVTAVDISKTSIELMKKQAVALGFENIHHENTDALLITLNKPVDAAISCFLLEHLETPSELFDNLSSNIKPGGFAFVTAALTAAEIDHIYEFSRESELVLMAEKAGFRLVSSCSSAPANYPQEKRFLPRSMALLLQKRCQEFW